jgi:hypothetical protein
VEESAHPPPFHSGGDRRRLYSLGSLHTGPLLSCIFRKRLHKVANHHLPLGPERMENRGHIRLVTGEMRAYGDIYTDILQIIANFSLFSL